MKEKIYFVCTLFLAIMYCVEVIPKGNYNVANYIAFAIALVTIISWLLSILIAIKKKSKEKDAQRQQKEAIRKAKEDEKNKKIAEKQQKAKEKNLKKFK